MDNKMKLKLEKILPIVLLVGVLILVGYCLYAKYMEKYQGGGGYFNECEFQPDCLWDTGRTIQLSDGRAGVCTLHGKACPAFQVDHTRSKAWGLSPVMVDTEFQAAQLQALAERRKIAEMSDSGETAKEMLL